MLNRILGRLTYANVMATVAVFIAIGGGAYAAGLAKNSVRSKQIKNGAVKTADLGKDAVTSKNVGAGSLLASDFAAGQLPAGKDGEDGVDGADGTDGDDGSPDTPAQVLGKLTTVDGAGSGLSADNLDGQDSTDFGDVQSSRVFIPSGSTIPSYASPTGLSTVTSSRVAVATGTPARNLVLRDLYVQLTGAANGPVTFTVSNQDSSGTITCTVNGGTACSANSGSGTVTLGSTLAIQVDESVAANAANVTATVGFRLTPG